MALTRTAFIRHTTVRGLHVVYAKNATRIFCNLSASANADPVAKNAVILVTFPFDLFNSEGDPRAVPLIDKPIAPGVTVVTNWKGPCGPTRLVYRQIILILC